ncbi:hypothetical protein B0J18DRAFT_33479 [Chaetomium sp. MPI-SDFR-AT-0129]|nr:hypothetical protein B0J18DRAFT_33479 [Chaetomium sp. MPI-SDFR-AT-0129]
MSYPPTPASSVWEHIDVDDLGDNHPDPYQPRGQYARKPFSPPPYSGRPCAGSPMYSPYPPATEDGYGVVDPEQDDASYTNTIGHENQDLPDNEERKTEETGFVTTPLFPGPDPQSGIQDALLPPVYRYHTFPTPTALLSSQQPHRYAQTGWRRSRRSSIAKNTQPYQFTAGYVDGRDMNSMEITELDLGNTGKRRLLGWSVKVGVAVGWMLLLVLGAMVVAGWVIEGKEVAWGFLVKDEGEWGPCTNARPRFCRLVVGAEE